MKTTAAVIAAAATACVARVSAPDSGATRLSSPVVSAAPARAELPSLLSGGDAPSRESVAASLPEVRVDARGRPVMAGPAPSGPVPLAPTRPAPVLSVPRTIESVRRMLGKEASK